MPQADPPIQAKPSGGTFLGEFVAAFRACFAVVFGILRQQCSGGLVVDLWQAICQRQASPAQMGDAAPPPTAAAPPASSPAPVPESTLAAWRRRFEGRRQERLERRRKWDVECRRLRAAPRLPAEPPVADEPSPADLPDDLAEALLPAAAPPPAAAAALAPGSTLLAYRLPDLDLLEPLPPATAPVSPEEIRRKRGIIQDTLDSFGLDADVRGATSGPRVTLYEVEPTRGVKVEGISQLRNNIAMELAAATLRILAPVPGQSCVGIEVPNDEPQTVPLRAVLEAASWRDSEARIPLALGCAIDGRMAVFDLARAPHLLIAGATGSGKSVCLNTIIMSLLYRFGPDDLRLVLVDPKVVEFASYQELPHLLMPVLHSARQTVGALKWIVQEMERRYRLLADHGVRHLADFNAAAGQPGQPPPLPYIVVVIDELADIMMTAREDVETLLARITQLSRAVGIHTVVATQRPSVNVITGIIKANYPARIAFQVASQVDSRTVIDGKGAESLLGQGDLLFKTPERAGLDRIQGAYVGDAEIDRVLAAVCEQRQTRFDERVLLQIKDADAGPAEQALLPAEDDELFGQAVEIVLRDRRASTSYLQRRLRIGYNRAALLMEEMEQRGIVGPPLGANQREILVEEVP